MLDELRKGLGISSFEELEWAIKREYDRGFSRAVAEFLERLDGWVYEHIDRRRYKSHEIRERTVETVLGTEVRFRRRYYLDVETGEYVALLDELLMLPKGEQISPGLRQVAAQLGVEGPSYRAAARQLAHCHGRRVLSHESVRQAVLEAGEKAAQQALGRRKEPAGKKRVQVLWIEADGGIIALQRSRRRRVEEKLVVSHEGWRRRHPASEEYELVHPRAFALAAEGEDFWDAASRELMRHYDLEDSVVVINGDRAGWIRRGVEMFPRAIYQVDRFHLKRELRHLFAGCAEGLRAVYEALESEDETGATFVACLAQWLPRLKSREQRQACQALLRDLASMPEAVVDYRVRLRKLYGLDTEGMRGMGAAESQIDRFTDRLRGRGQSWSLRGLQAIVELIGRRMEGRLSQVLHRLRSLMEEWGKPVIDATALASRAAANVLSDTLGIPVSHPPVMDVGRVRSGGMSWFMRRIAHGTSL